jgi:anti-anti-sigma factor
MARTHTLPVASTQVIVVLASDPTEDTVVWLGGDHDLHSVEDLVRAIATAAGAGRSDLVFDLSRVDFMDSTTIDRILAACTILGEDGRVARIRNPSPVARRLLELCRLTDLVDR